MRFGVVVLLGISTCWVFAGQPYAKHKGWAERRPEFKRRLARLESRADLTPEQRSLHERVMELLAKSKRFPTESYLVSRLCAAVDSFLDASEELQRARGPDQTDAWSSDERRHTARTLEHTYFRVKQGGYFSEQSKDSHGSELVRLSRRLYQQARSAYDRGEFFKARRLAAASREVISGLERLAQAAAPIPTPPPLH